MTKALRTFNLDVRLIEKLSKEANQSNLVNSLLEKHYDVTWARNMPKDQLRDLIKKMEERDKLETEIKEVENAHRSI